MGLYSESEKHMAVQMWLKINPDGSFLATAIGDIGGKFETKGKWSINKDTLRLYNPATNSIFTVEHYNIMEDKTLQIEIRDKKDSLPIPALKVIVNGVSAQKTGTGHFKTAFQLVSQLKVDYMNNLFNIQVDNIKDNRIVVFFDFKKAGANVVIDSLWLVNRNKLKSISSTVVFRK